MSIPCPVIGPDGTEYPSLTRAEAAVRIDRRSIVAMIESGDKGWRWRDGERPKLPPRVAKKRTRRVVSPRGRVYESALVAARWHHAGATTIRRWCRDPNSGWHYEDEHPLGSAPPTGLRPGLYADDVALRHPRERAVYLRGGG